MYSIQYPHTNGLGTEIFMMLEIRRLFLKAYTGNLLLQFIYTLLVCHVFLAPEQNASFKQMFFNSRYLRGAGFERLQKALAAQDGRRSPIAPPSPSVTSLAKYSFSVVSY